MDPKGKMNHILLVIWVVVGVAIVVGTAIMQGYEGDERHNSYNEDIASAVCLGISWPIILAIGTCIFVIAAPIWLLRKLGAQLRKLTR